MTTFEILKAARELISDEKRWTQGFYAVANGWPVVQFASEHLPDSADCFCAIGSLAKAGCMSVYDAESSGAYKALEAVSEIDVHEFNDTHTHEEVLALFDRAISRAEAGAA